MRVKSSQGHWGGMKLILPIPLEWAWKLVYLIEYWIPVVVSISDKSAMLMIRIL